MDGQNEFTCCALSACGNYGVFATIHGDRFRVIELVTKDSTGKLIKEFTRGASSAKITSLSLANQLNTDEWYFAAASIK